AALGIDVAAGIAVIGRVRIDQAAGRAMLLRQFGLEAAPAAAVARDDDLALHADPAPRERIVIVGHAVIDVDHRRGDVAVALVSDIWRQRAGELVGAELWLLPTQGHAVGPDQFERGRDRR